MDVIGSEYWESDRASFEDELNAFRERTARVDESAVQHLPERQGED